MMINYDEILNIIESQFKNILYGENYYNGYSVTIAKEQDFVKIRDNKDPKHIYIIVKFQSASLNYHQYLLPLTITALSEQNKLDVCQRLLLEYAETYNLSMSNDETIKQFYDAPQVLSNFEEIYYGYRSILHMSGTFLVNVDANPFKYYLNVFETNNNEIIEYIDEKTFFNEIVKKRGMELNTTHSFSFNVNYNDWVYDNKNENLGHSLDVLGIKVKKELLINNLTLDVSIKQQEIPSLNNQDNFNINHDTQLFFSRNNNVESQGQSKLEVISITSYLLDNDFINRVLAIKVDDYVKQPRGEDTDFCITIKYKNGITGTKTYKLVSISQQEQIAQFPVINIGLSL